MIVTTRVPVTGDGAGRAAGWTATAAPTPPAVRTTATARPRSAPPLPNTLLPPSDDDPYEVLVRSSTGVVLLLMGSSVVLEVLVESRCLARLMVAFCEVRCVAGCVGIQAGSQFEIAVLLMEVRGDRFAPR